MAESKAGKNFLTSKDKPGLKALLVAALVLVMTVPLFFIAVILNDRQTLAEEVQREVGYEWGGQAQTLAGPFLIIPFERDREVGDDEHKRVVTTRRYAVVLPRELNLSAQLVSETLHRGIYQVPVYEADIAVEGVFSAIDPMSFAEPDDEIMWDEVIISLSLTDTRGIRSAINLEMAQRRFAFEPGARLAVFGASGANVVVPGMHGAAATAQDAIASVEGKVDFAADQAFHFSLALNGSTQLRFLPIGQTTTAQMTSDWQDPSFRGAFLPVDRSAGDNGFTASWSVPNLARSFPDQFVVTESSANQQSEALARAAFGVDFVVPLDHYQKIFRALRYAVIFIGFTFLAFFLVELILKTRLHPVQYFLIGAAQSVFYLLLLSASEHIGFGPAFALAATATVTLITTYGGFIARSLKVGAALLGVLSLIYFLLYSLLLVEDFALLLGSIAIFAALALTMLVTRDVNWYGEEKKMDNNASA